MVYFSKNSLREEFYELDKRVKKIVYVLSAMTDALHGSVATVTSVNRDDIHSPHHYHRAADVRSKFIKDEDCLFLVNILNIIFPYGKGAFETALYHEVDQGWHFHIQVKAKTPGND